MRQDKQSRYDRLVSLIEATVADEPAEFEGQVWAVRRMEDWAELAGISLATLKRYVLTPPIRRTHTHVEGVKAILLRVGAYAPPTEREIANFMKSLFLRNTGHEVPQSQYGILKGLAQKWPDGVQTEIFKMVLDDWPAFKAGVTIEVEMMIDEGEDARHIRHDYPSVSVMLRFHQVAVDMYVMKLQESGKAPPPSVEALDPSLWRHLHRAMV